MCIENIQPSASTASDDSCMGTTRLRMACGSQVHSRRSSLTSHLLTTMVVVGVYHFPVSPSAIVSIISCETTSNARTSGAWPAETFDGCCKPWTLPTIKSSFNSRPRSMSQAALRSSCRARPGNTQVENHLRMPVRSPQRKCSSANRARFMRSGSCSMIIAMAPLQCSRSEVTGLRYRLINLISGKSSGTDCARLGRHFSRSHLRLVWSSSTSFRHHTARNALASAGDGLLASLSTSA